MGLEHRHRGVCQGSGYAPVRSSGGGLIRSEGERKAKKWQLSKTVLYGSGVPSVLHRRLRQRLPVRVGDDPGSGGIGVKNSWVLREVTGRTPDDTSPMRQERRNLTRRTSSTLCWRRRKSAWVGLRSTLKGGENHYFLNVTSEP